MRRHLSPISASIENLSRADLVELWLYWTGGTEAPSDESEAREQIKRAMGDRGRVIERFRGLPDRCKDLLLVVAAREGRRAFARQLVDPNHPEAAKRLNDLESWAAPLRKRGFLLEDRERAFAKFHDPAWRVPDVLADALAGASKNGPRALETRFSLKSFLRTLEPEELAERGHRFGVKIDSAADPAIYAEAFARRDRVKKGVAALKDPELKELVEKALEEHGGLMDRAFLDRIEAPLPRDLRPWRAALEAELLGTVFDGDLADVGIMFKPGSITIFFENARSWMDSHWEVAVDEPPEPPADVLGDLERIRDYLDHHVLRVTREGSLYRATARKMETEVLSAGSRPGTAEEALDFLLEFLSAHDLIRADDDQRLRPRPGWKTFAEKSTSERCEILLKYVQEDLRSTKAEFHHGRLRRIFLALLKESGSGRWLALRKLCHASRNFYLATLDQRTTSDRFQRRYQYAQLPPMAPPSVLSRELVQFGGATLAKAGFVELHAPEDGAPAIRLTKLGSAVLGLLDATGESRNDAGMLVMGDLEIVVFPDKLDLGALQVISRFAKREKADVTLHFRLSERSVQEAVAGGAHIEQLVDTMVKFGRYEPPQNVVASVLGWAKAVTVFEARRTWLLKAPSKEILEQALKLRELKAIAGERLNEVTLEVSEDPTAVRISETLRSHGFFLR